MMAQPSTAVAPELDEIARRLGELAAGDVRALGLLRPALHRVVVAQTFSGEVKTLLVQALLLLDDPRIGDGTSGNQLLPKIRKLFTAAQASHARRPRPSTPLSQPAISARAEFSPDALLSPSVDQSLLQEFLVEAREQLQSGEAALLVLDSDPDDLQALETLFRSLHSIKGTSAFLGIEHATELAHHAESLLGKVRAGSLACTAELSNLIFRAIDTLDAMIVAIEQMREGEVPMVPNGYRELLVDLRDGPSAGGSPSTMTRRNSGQFRRLLSADLNVRIRAVELDRLAEVVHELVLAHEMLARDASMRANPDLARKTAFAERLAFELEDMTSELRTVPFSASLQRLARLARDAAYQNGKSVELAMEGDDVLVERVMVDSLADPLMHMVRNAIDHGIEPTSERVAAGKPPAGRLRIAAKREAKQLVIEITDDGRGIDQVKLQTIAVERGLVAAGTKLDEHDAFALLFRPGFTTASVVTDLSGRGVGMDVVRTNVDAIGGTIDVSSRLGAGTTFTIRLPYRTHVARAGITEWEETDRPIGLIA
jgi:two-component system, chemotaxis family, sensor kinase CheA